MGENYQSVKSRPKAIVLHAGSVEHGAEPMCDVLDRIGEAALATGLPIIVITSAVGSVPGSLQDVEPPQITITQDSQHAVNILTEKAFCKLSDVLWLTGAMENGTISEGVSATPFEVSVVRDFGTDGGLS